MRTALVLLFAMVVTLVRAPSLRAAEPSLYRSSDGGHTWQPVDTSPVVSSVFDVFADPAHPGHLILATDLSLWFSQDGGISWVQRPLPGGPDPETVYALAADPNQPSHVWAASERGVWASVDSGATWRLAGDDTPKAVALTATAADGHVRLYAGTSEGLWASDDVGGTWHGDGDGLQGAAMAIAVTPEGDLLVGTTVGLFARATTESTFSLVRGLPTGGSRAAYVAPDGTIYAAVGSNLYRRENGWIKLATLPLAANGDSPGIAAILKAEDLILLGTEHGLHSSESWKPVPPFDQRAYLEVAALAADPADPSVVYAGASTVPNSIGYAKVGVIPNAATVERPDDRLTFALLLVFLLGGVFVVYYMRRLTRAQASAGDTIAAEPPAEEPDDRGDALDDPTPSPDAP
jgi:hypothetical protein